MPKRMPILVVAAALVAAAGMPAAAASAASAANGPADQASPQAKEVTAYWTPERRAAAIPRDLALDDQGRGYIRGANGGWVPYGSGRPAGDPVIESSAGLSTEQSARPVPMAKPGGGTADTTAPIISGLDPAVDATIGSSYTFKATVSDGTGSGVRSVSFVLTYPSGTTRSYSTTRSGTTYSTAFSGFTDGLWSWHVVAKDNAGNTRTTSKTAFRVNTSGGTGGGGTGTTVADASWTGGGTVQRAAGRIFFSMPTNGPKLGDYVCSGTAVSDGGVVDRSLILTAAHCVYDDASKVFAKNVLFIPDQSGTSAASSDRTCSNDPIGCWTPSFGVVDVRYTESRFPSNSPWDYAFYVVQNNGTSYSPGKVTVAAPAYLETSVTPMSIQFTTASTGRMAQAMGYSYSQDPRFRYCKEALGTEAGGDLWLGQCGLSGGASGGPWLQGADETIAGSEQIISVNSWGYTTAPGMAGPPLAGAASTAECVYDAARSAGADLRASC